MIVDTSGNAPYDDLAMKSASLARQLATYITSRDLCCVQGAAIAAYASAGPGITADICSPANRGTLFGICSVAALLGPVIGPPLGGGLSQVGDKQPRTEQPRPVS